MRFFRLNNLNAPGIRLYSYIAAFLFFPTLVAHAQQSQEPSSWMLAKIDASGLHRFDQALVIAESGLKVGERVDLTTINTATERLRSGGLFAKVGYGYRYAGDQLELTFKLEEAVWNIPVFFDNFIWFSDQELIQAVAKEIPTFAGTAPKSGPVIDRITKILERQLKERQIAGQVEYLPSYEQSGADKEHIFSVKGSNLPLCVIHFPNASGIPESELVKNSKPLFSNAYSKSFIADFTRVNLIPLYRERGHLRVQFLGVQAKAETTNCKNGVTVAVLFDEGLVYKLDKVEWKNNATLSVKDLDALLAMRSGEVANGVKFDNGLKAIKVAYGKKGFIRAALTPQADFDDGQRLVRFQIAVSEGEQYRMGNVIIEGLPDGDAERVKKQWKLKAGEIYDASYVNEFLKTGLDVKLRGRVSSIKLNTSRDAATVDVKIGFK